MMIKYCPKCHKEAYRLEKDKDNVKVIQNGRTFISVSQSSSVSMSINCPSGHPVKLEIKDGARQT